MRGRVAASLPLKGALDRREGGRSRSLWVPTLRVGTTVFVLWSLAFALWIEQGFLCVVPAIVLMRSWLVGAQS